MTSHLKGDPCNKDFVPNTKVSIFLTGASGTHSHVQFQGKIYTMYISKNSRTDYDTWMGVAKCFKLWDLDARGFHKVSNLLIHLSFILPVDVVLHRACGDFGSRVTRSS